MQAEGAEMDTAAASTSGNQANIAGLSKEQLSTLCEKLQQELQAPAQVRLGNPNADVLGRSADYMVCTFWLLSALQC